MYIWTLMEMRIFIYRIMFKLYPNAHRTKLILILPIQWIWCLALNNSSAVPIVSFTHSSMPGFTQIGNGVSIVALTWTFAELFSRVVTPNEGQHDRRHPVLLDRLLGDLWAISGECYSDEVVGDEAEHGFPVAQAEVNGTCVRESFGRLLLDELRLSTEFTL